MFFIIKFVSLSWFLQLYHFYGLFTADSLYEEVMSVRLYDNDKAIIIIIFGQCLPGIFLAKCCRSLCNVGATYAATSYYQKIKQSRIKIAKRWCCSDNIALGFFLCNVVCSLLGNIAQRFCLFNVVPRVLQQHWQKMFHVQCCLEPLGQHCTRFFLAQCCMETQKQYCIGYLLVQCCPKSFTTTLNKIFSCVMLSGASWQHWTRFLPVVPRVLRQHWTWFFKTTLNKIFSYVMLSRASWAILHKVFTCAMLSQEY